MPPQGGIKEMNVRKLFLKLPNLNDGQHVILCYNLISAWYPTEEWVNLMRDTIMSAAPKTLDQVQE